MNNYTSLASKIKDQEVNFIKKLTKNMGKIDTHFVTDMINGIISSDSIILSELARCCSPTVNIKKTVERLGRHLDEFDAKEKQIMENYESLVKDYINPRHLYFVDGTDIIKC